MNKLKADCIGFLRLSQYSRQDVGYSRRSGPSATKSQGARVLYDYDVIVVGGGAGGATFAYACARAGKSVLVLERGERYTADGPSHDEKAMLIDKGPYDDREVDV